MGKFSGPKPPPAPDPYAVAAAQTQSNKETAVANANLNRIDQHDPYGSSTYTVTGTNADGTPKYRQDTTLSPAQQALLDSQQELDLGLNRFAGRQMTRVEDAMGTSLDMSKAPALRGGLDFSTLPQLQLVGQAPTSLKVFENGGPIQSGVQGGQYQTGYSSGGPIQSGVQGQQYQTGFSAGGPIQNGIGTTADRINGNIANVGQAQRSTGFTGNVQDSLNYSGLTALPGTSDFGAERQRMEDAMYGRATSRLDPRFEQDQRRMETQLVNMGIARGSAAWNREMDTFGRTRNDAYSTASQDAVMAGSSEQSRLFGLAMGARQQGQNEVNTQGQFRNAADQQKYNYAMGDAQLYNQAQAQDFGQAATRTQVGNDAANAQFGQMLAQGQFANTAQQQQFGQNATQADFANQARMAQYQQSLSQGQFANTAQAQQYGQNQAAAQFANSATKDQFNQNLAQGEFANSAQQQQFGQNAAQTAFFNDAVNQDFSNDNAAFSASAAARAQLLGEQSQDATMSNAARQQYMQEEAYLRNMPIQDIAALLGTSNGVQQPQFNPVPGIGMDGTNLQGAVYDSYNGRMNAWQQQQAARASTLGAIFGAVGTAGGMAAMSDRRVKHSLKRIGKTAAGIPTYVFSYLGSKARHFGVMAQDVLHIPGAAINDNGLYYVDYGKVW